MKIIKKIQDNSADFIKSTLTFQEIMFLNRYMVHLIETLQIFLNFMYRVSQSTYCA